jgi:Uma2 family endonuclease
MSVGVKAKPRPAAVLPRPCNDIPPIHIPASAFTHDGFRAWATSDAFPERLRASYINHEIVIDMSPEELETHNKVKTKVVSRLDALNERLDLGELFSDRTLLSNLAAGLSTEPDGTFATWSSFESGRVRLVTRNDRPGQYVELIGTPDWVLEVVSRSSVQKDTVLLRDLYHGAGILEYWLIDAQYEEIEFQILRRRRDRYVAVGSRGGWRRSAVFGRAFRLDRRKNRLGRWTYSLEIAPA